MLNSYDETSIIYLRKVNKMNRSVSDLILTEDVNITQIGRYFIPKRGDLILICHVKLDACESTALRDSRLFVSQCACVRYFLEGLSATSDEDDVRSSLERVR